MIVGIRCGPVAAASIALALAACGPAPKTPRAGASAPPSAASSASLPRPEATGAARATSAALVGWKRAQPPLPRGFATTTAYEPLTGAARGELSVRSLRVRAVVVGGLARTEVAQELSNPHAKTLEATFSFPLPSGAHLSRLALGHGNRLLEGKVLDSDKIGSIPRGPATGPFDDGWWRRDDAFTATIVAFAPKQTRSLLLAYDEALEKYAAGREVYRYSMLGEPPATSPGDLSIEVTLLGAPQRFGKITTSYPAEVRASADRVTVAFARRAFVPDGDFSVEFARTRPGGVDVGVDVPGWKKPPEHELLEPAGARTTLPREAGNAIGQVSFGLDLPDVTEAEPGAVAPRLTRVVLLDKSYGVSIASFALRRGLIEQLLLHATANERYALLACDSACERWPADGATPIDAQRAAAAATWLHGLTPSGSFDLEGALASAVGALEPGGRAQIAYLGQGWVSAGTLQPGELLAAASLRVRRSGADLRIFDFGARPEGAALLELAKATDATHAPVSAAIPAELQAPEILRALRAPKLTDVKLELPAGIQDPSPKSLPALVMGQPFRVTARLTAPTLGKIRVSGRLQGRDYAALYPVQITSDGAEPNPLVTSWWARERLREAERGFSDTGFHFGASELSQSARVASRHTDWLVLESDASASKHPRGVFTERTTLGLASSPSHIAQRQQKLPPLAAKARLELEAPSVRDGASPNAEREALRKREVLRLKTGFQRCYEQTVARTEDWFEGRVDFSLRIGARGGFESLAAETRPARDFRAVFSCLRAVAAPTSFEPPLGASAELRFSAEFAVNWSQGLRVHYAMPPEAFSGQGSIEPVITPGDDSWASAAPGVLTAALFAPNLESAVTAALKGVENEPWSPRALDLLAAAAGASNDSPSVSAVLEAELAHSPGQHELRRRAARAWLAAGDERRACAHLQSLPLVTSAPGLVRAKTLCRRRWLGEPDHPSSTLAETEPAKPLIERALEELDDIRACHPFSVTVHCEDARRCPIAVVVTPEWQIISSFGSVPGHGRTEPLSFWPAVFGAYRVLLLGGEPLARGSVDIAVHLDSKRFEFHRGGAGQTIASVELRSERPSPGAMGVPLCGAVAK